MYFLQAQVIDYDTKSQNSTFILPKILPIPAKPQQPTGPPP